MLTFETIRDLERAERESKKMQRIPESFLAELKDYIAKKESTSAPQEVMEFQAIKGTIARLLEMRERKIVDGALITARTGLPPENLLPSEAELFWVVVERLKRFREDFFGKATQPSKKVWRVVRSTEFVGPDMKEYKLQQGETPELSADIVEILRKDGLIEEVK